MSNEFKQIANDIFDIVGPKENIISVECCMTRLRLVLKTNEHVNKDALKQIPGVLGIADTPKELQIILGPTKIRQVKEEFSNIVMTQPEIGEGNNIREQLRQKNATPFKLLLKRISSIFLPMIPAFIACGLITGILNIVLKCDPSLANTGIVALLKVIGNAAFWGLNLFIGVNAAKEFGGSPILGGTIAAILTHPGLANVTIFDHTLLPGRGGVFAVLMAAAFVAWLEKRVRKSIPPLLDLFLTPLIVISVASFVTLGILQPIGGVLSDTIGYLAVSAIEAGGSFTGFVLGGTFLPLVITGIHQGLTPIHAELLNTTGITILLPILAMAGAGQVGASAAVYVKTKNSRLRKTIASSLPVGIMGIGEPLIYGVTLPLGKPFVAACIGGAFGGAVQASYIVGATSLGLSGLPLAASTNNMFSYLIGLVTAYVAGFIAAYIIGFQDPPNEESNV